MNAQMTPLNDTSYNAGIKYDQYLRVIING
jgi:hypothetical protein